MKEPGFVYLPYKTKISQVEVNGEIVWYKNKWKNLLLKIKNLWNEYSSK